MAIANRTAANLTKCFSIAPNLYGGHYGVKSICEEGKQTRTKMAARQGVEPRCALSKSAVLPLNERAMEQGRGVEPRWEGLQSSA